ncbi:protein DETOXIFICATION 45, chloroplastic [Amaranthus tricolor]|uniref:protein DETOXIFICATION 45, chloroplastic n=1 Tax=Amaranthus tricolor TaxID=29722 RepID=UPI002590C5D5|nr:protein DETOXIFICATION 45, chloroplastic [Amaranthus tricolor]
MMTAAQLCGVKISTAFSNTRKRWCMHKTWESDVEGRSRGFCSSLSFAIQRSCVHDSGRCYVSFDRRKLSHNTVLRRRKPFKNVSYSLVGSDVDEEPQELAENSSEENTLENDNDANGSSAIVQSSNQLPPQNIKRELIMLSLPAIASQAIDPFAQLMETVYIGKIGSVELASAGVSMSIFNLISKLFNIPLLSVATSFVAEDIAKSSTDGDETVFYGKSHHEELKRKQLSSVSTALLLAVGIGIIEALALLLGTGSFLSLMGIAPDSPMRVPAHRFLSLRALGAPAVVLSLALQGVLRGFKDTKTPVFCLGIANVAAIFLFPLFIYKLQMGVTGAAIATFVSQYIGSFMMLWFLSKRVILLPPKLGDLKFGIYLKSGGFLIGRTLAVLVTMTIGTSMAARQGPIAMAAHQICVQVWLAVSLLTDALAASGQALVASSMSRGDYSTVKELTNFVLKIGIVTGGALAVILGASYGYFVNLFTNDSAVLQIVKAGTLFVSASQPLNALAFIFDGLHYGASDFPYAACSTMLVGAISSTVLLYAPTVIGLPGVWLGLTLFMGLRTAAGYFRILSRNGPWWFLHSDYRQVMDVNQLGTN